MAEQIIIIVNSENEKEFGQILKNIISATGVYEATLWTKDQYTDTEKMISSVKKVVFIGENDVSKRHLSSINWKFESPNMRYGWIGSYALISVGDTLFTKKQLGAFKKMAQQQKQEIKNLNKKTIGVINGSGVIGTLGALATIGGVLFPVLIPVGLVVAIGGLVVAVKNTTKMLVKQRKVQYKYIINHFVLHGIDEYMGLKNGLDVAYEGTK